jgi:hypothetical protein
MYRDSVRNRIVGAIRKYGNDGYVLRVKNSNPNERNSYDEYGNEVTLLDTEEKKENIEKIHFRYTVKNLRGMELARFSDSSERERITCVSQDFFNEDFLNNKILKGDEFIGFNGVKFSIEEVHHVGNTQNGEIVLELICART